LLITGKKNPTLSLTKADNLLSEKSKSLKVTKVVSKKKAIPCKCTQAKKKAGKIVPRTILEFDLNVVPANLNKDSSTTINKDE